MVKFFVLSILFNLIHLFCKGQDQTLIPRILPNGPNSASFARFEDYHVDLFSGLPQISIPLYTIDVNGLKVPISLDYHASGIKITDFPSWVGAGWNVMAGGQIRRKLMGQPDEEENGYLSNQTKDVADINTNTYDGINYLNGVNNGNIDTQADIFSFNIPGKSGKFFLNRDNNYDPAQLPFSPLRISKIWSNNQLSFNILDEQGNSYSFGQPDVESTQTSNGGVISYTTSAWMLNKMVSADLADTISFSYNTSPSVSYEDLIDSWVVDDEVTLLADNPDDNIPALVFQANPAASITSSYISTMVNEKPLSEIKFKNGKIGFELGNDPREDFFSSNNPKALSKLNVYNYDYENGQYELLKTIAFFQSYFINGTDQQTKRLRLDSIQIEDKNNIPVETYRFDYNTNISLPVRNSKQRDFWGYYNGKANNYLIPRMEIPYISGINTDGSSLQTIGSNIPGSRDPDPLFMQAEMLTRIYFPTKGYTDFEYETNQYEDLGHNFHYAGGLRIKSIKTYDGVFNTPLIKTYKYGRNESGAGRANFILSNYYLNIEQKYKRYVMVSGGPVLAQTKRTRTFLSNPTIEIEAYDAIPVVYPVVTEYTGDESNNIGKIVYEYRDYPDLITSASFVKPEITSYFYRRGQLISKKIFKKVGATYQPVKENTYSYTAFPQSVNFGGLLVKENEVGGNILPPGTDPNDAHNWIFSNYTISSEDVLPTSETEILYNPDDTSKVIKTEKSLNYGNIVHQQPTEIITMGSKGYELREKYKYPADYINIGVATTGNAVLDTMLSKNMQASVIEKINSLTKPLNVESVIRGQVNIYERLLAGHIVKNSQKQLIVESPITDFQPSVVNSGVLQLDPRYKTMITFDVYSAFTKINQFTIKNTETTSYLWDYGGNLPIAEIKNASINNSAYTSFEADGSGNWSFTGIPIPDANAPTGSKVYDLSLTTPLSKSGLNASETYIVSYWTKNSSPFVISGTEAGYPAGGPTVNSWKYYEHRVSGETSISINGTGLIDEVRLYPITSQMKTMTYKPLIGLSSQCDEANHISYYEYDTYGRLMLQKDQNKNIIKTFKYNFKK